MSVPQVLTQARDRYLAKGIPPGGAIALPAVLYYESHLNPGSQGYQSSETPGVLNPHGAYGIASWNGPRQQDLLDFATKHNLPADALYTQLDFVLNEIANNYPKSWAAIRSSASYKSIIPILVDEYENPKDKNKEIYEALVIAAALATLPEAQPAPPAPIPQAPAPEATPVVLPAPAAPAGLPPISASSAGRRTAVLDNLEAMRAAYLEERASIDAEIAILDTTIADFGKLAPMIIPMVLPKPVAATTPIPQQRSKSVFGPNWITSVFGTGSIAGALATLALDFYNKQTPDAASISLIFSSLMAGFGLVQAKDKNVTGGTISNVTGLSGPPISLVEMEKKGGVRQPI